jgi:hypothetical protein
MNPAWFTLGGQPHALCGLLGVQIDPEAARDPASGVVESIGPPELLFHGKSSGLATTKHARTT